MQLLLLQRTTHLGGVIASGSIKNIQIQKPNRPIGLGIFLDRTRRPDPRRLRTNDSSSVRFDGGSTAAAFILNQQPTIKSNQQQK